MRAAGDISRGAASTGAVWEDVRGRLGTIEVGPTGAGSILVDKPVDVWELIGRGVVVSAHGEEEFAKNDPDTIVGVIARSAGVWENEKTVCGTLVEREAACSGTEHRPREWARWIFPHARVARY